MQVVEYLAALEDIDVAAATPAHGTTPLTIACQGGHLGVVNALLPRLTLAQIMQPTANGGSAFYNACEKGCLPVVRRLAEVEGINVTQGNNNGASPLYIACEMGHSEVRGRVCVCVCVRSTVRASRRLPPPPLTRSWPTRDRSSRSCWASPTPT